MIDLGDVIRSLATGTYTITRGAAVTWTNGRAVPGATSQLTVLAVVVPSSGRDLQRLPEGFRTTAGITLLTTDPLQTASVKAQTPADVVTYGGDRYEVQTVEPWAEAAGFYRSVATKIEEVP